LIEVFERDRLGTMINRSGPVWRWQEGDPVAAELSPSSPEQFAKAAELRQLLVAGLPMRLSAVAFGEAVERVEFSLGGIVMEFKPDVRAERALFWSITGGMAQEAFITLYTRAAEGVEPSAPLRIEAEGPWALFRLMDQAVRENAGEGRFRATFGEGNRSVTLMIALPGVGNPFAAGGPWAFRCPIEL